MPKDAIATYITPEDIAQKVGLLGQAINQYYREQNIRDLVVICVLNGAVVFTADLIRQLDLTVILDFIKVSSYNDAMVSSGQVKIKLDVSTDYSNKHILLVEDIVDTGRTLSKVKAMLSAQNAASVKVATLLDKPSRRVVDFHADFVGFEVPDLFVIGYGLDYAEKYRHLPYIGILSPSNI